MKRRSWWQRLLTAFGDVKVFPWPMFFLYDPEGDAVTGAQLREVMKRVRPGDILVRGYRRYLDGYFIPGYFSHVGMYVGPVDPAQASLLREPCRGLFVPGEQIVVHAMAEGVLMEDLLEFGRCDRLAVLRFPEVLRRNDHIERGLSRKQFTDEEWSWVERIEAGESISFAEVWPLIFRTLLGQVGRPYDFDFRFTNFRSLSCSELVFFATKCLMPFLKVLPREERVLFLRKMLIRPDAFAGSPLELVWASPSCDPAELEALRKSPPPLSLPVSRAA